jgi:UrcA family protein
MKTLILIGALAAVAAPAAAQVGSIETSTTVVRRSDLDLSRPAHAGLMAVRIQRAARRVCGERTMTRELMDRAAFNACFRATVTSAVAGLDAPLVTARFAPSEPTRVATR